MLSFQFWPQSNPPDVDFNDRQSRITKAWNLLFLFIIPCIILSTFLNKDLWQDELYTTDHYIAAPPGRVFSKYDNTNNHIVFNFIANTVNRVTGKTDFRKLLDHPDLIRLIPAIFTILSILVFFRTTKKYFSNGIAILATSIYSTSLQLYTFGTQVRGYSLELLLCVIQIYLLLRYRERKQKKTLVLVTLTGFLLLLNLPSTLYYYSSLLLCIAGLLGWMVYKKKNNREIIGLLYLLVSLLLGMMLAGIYFAIQIKNISALGISKTNGNDFFSLLKQPIAVFYRFIDFRLLIIPVFLFSVFAMLRDKKYKISLLFPASLLLPFLLFGFHNPPMIQRIWIVLLPAFSIFIAETCFAFFEKRKQLLLPFAVIQVLTLLFSIFILKKESFANNRHFSISLDLRNQYNLFGYHPNETIKTALSLSVKENSAIVICDGFKSGIQYYTRGIPSLKLGCPDSGMNSVVYIFNKRSCFTNCNIADYRVVDSGKNNPAEFYKYYVLKRIR